ncbi:hypothetical protein OIDMADRAFT_36800 [Oidiodendron maius Zn]|uniref:FAD-binding oxidoreductase/transferase type 4 C-terminal domain-containing protein n=1 Tax=Oidiodendron maius (strain Zn) TaxID=913774 RepID=A0A0C3DYR8_OIDMZ|nr:hypothetical protein OIDMADRAFT_36800 [Oidiodendron maius Zn]
MYLKHNLAEDNIRQACAEFADTVGKEHVSLVHADLLSYSGSHYQSYPWTEDTVVLGQVVGYPNTTEEVFQSGTSIEGQYIPTYGGICVDFTRMDKILRTNSLDLDCTVQPGAMIGGMVGTGCSGTNATRQRPRKSSAGYDLTRTFIGSEGTLGLITEATLKLAVKPKCEVVAACTFPPIRKAALAVQSIVSRGLQVAAVEILNEVQMRSINEAKSTTRIWKEGPSLFFKFNGSSDVAVNDTANLVKSITESHGSTSFTFASSADEREELWSARRASLWSIMALRKSPEDKVWITDVTVPLRRLADTIEKTKKDIVQSGLLGAVFRHVGDGNFHTLILYSDTEKDIAKGLVPRMVDMAIAMEGAVTGEYGVGLVKRDYLESELGKSTVDIMRMLRLGGNFTMLEISNIW